MYAPDEEVYTCYVYIVCKYLKSETFIQTLFCQLN